MWCICVNTWGCLRKRPDSPLRKVHLLLPTAVHIMTAAVVGEDLETYFQKRQKIARSMYHQSAIWQSHAFHPASISNRYLPFSFLKWLEKNCWAKVPALLFPTDFKAKSFATSIQRFVLPKNDLGFVVKCKHFLAFSTAECSLKNALVRTSPPLITWLYSQGTETLPQKFSREKHALNFK